MSKDFMDLCLLTTYFASQGRSPAYQAAISMLQSAGLQGRRDLRRVIGKPRQSALFFCCWLLCECISRIKRCCEPLSKILTIIDCLVISVFPSPHWREPLEVSYGVSRAIELHKLVYR